MKRRSSLKSTPLPELTWSHAGTPHRVHTLPESPSVAAAEPIPVDPFPSQPEVRFERQVDGRWTDFEADPSSESFVSAAAALDNLQWDGFFGLLPRPVREFLGRFRFERLEALTVVTRCPALLAELDAVPALTAFLSAHVFLRGTDGPRWEEINALYERGGIFAVLEWLGLPASPQTLSVLQRIADPELPRHLLSPIRAALWEPECLWLLQRAESLTEEELATLCHPLAA